MRPPSASPSKSPATSCRSTPSQSRSCPARGSSGSPPTIRSPSGPSPSPIRAAAKKAAEFLARVRANAQSRQGRPNRRRIGGHGRIRARRIPLDVLPPRSPKLNGAVERRNGAWRYAFSACSDLPLDIDKIAKRVDAFHPLSNNHRPHGALAGMTRQSTSIRQAKETPPSHMSLARTPDCRSPSLVLSGSGCSSAYGGSIA